MENASKASIYLRAEGIPSGKSAGSAREVFGIYGFKENMQKFNDPFLKYFSMKNSFKVLLMSGILFLFSLNSKGLSENIKNRIDTSSQLKIARVWSDKPLARTGDTIAFSAFIENTGKSDAGNLIIELLTPEGISVSQSEQKISLISAGSYQRVNWNLRAEKSDTAQLGFKVFLKSKGELIDKIYIL